MISALAVMLCGCQKSENKKISKQGFYFDTIIQITLYGTDDEQYINDCFDIADRYEKMLSNTIDDSDISRINKAAGEQAVCVSDETVSLIQKGIEYGRLSGGKFDITIGELSNLIPAILATVNIFGLVDVLTIVLLLLETERDFGIEQ